MTNKGDIDAPVFVYDWGDSSTGEGYAFKKAYDSIWDWVDDCTAYDPIWDYDSILDLIDGYIG